MSKQFYKLTYEQLKEYYAINFEEYKKIKAVIIDLLRDKEKYVIELHDKLRVELESLPKQGGIRQEEVFESELHNVFDERNSLREEQRRASKEFYGPPHGGEDLQIDNFRAMVIEKKLDLIEEELNSNGIKVKIDNGKIIFEQENGE